MSDDDIERRMAAVERLTQLFRMERMIHLCVTVISLLMLLTGAGIALAKEGPKSPEFALMFGSSGLITYSASRLLQMWNQALSLIVPQMKEEKYEHSSSAGR
jgi:hypothetical protein